MLYISKTSKRKQGIVKKSARCYGGGHHPVQYKHEILKNQEAIKIS